MHGSAPWKTEETIVGLPRLLVLSVFSRSDSPDIVAVTFHLLADGATQALGGLRDNDQVNMIGHQAICPDRDLLCAAESRDELEVVLVIFLTEERLLSAVSPLGDIVGHARSYHTCQSSHGGKLTRPQPRVKS